MRIAVLHSSPRPSWTSMRLLNAALSLGVDASYILWDDLAVTVGDDGCRVLFRGRCMPFTAVIVRSLGRGGPPLVDQLLYRISVLQAMMSEGIVVVNPPEGMLAARNKLATTLRLRQCGLPMPESFASENPAHVLRYMREANSAVVVKPLTGSLGLGSILVRDVDQAFHVTKFLSALHQPIYMQRFIDKKLNRDMRVFVVEDRVAAAVYRYAPGTHWKTNVAQGARVEPAEPLPLEASRLAVEAARCLGLYYAGVDIAEDRSGQLYVLEVNASPLWRGLYRATGIDPAHHIVRMVVELAKRTRDSGADTG